MLLDNVYVFQRWWQQYLASHILFLQCDFDAPPIEKWGLCSCSLNLGGLVVRMGMILWDFQGWEIKSKTIFSWLYCDALHLEPATMLWESPCSHMESIMQVFLPTDSAEVLANRLHPPLDMRVNSLTDNSSFQPLSDLLISKSSQIGTRYHGAKTSCPCCALSKCLTHRIHEYNNIAVIL